MKHRPDCDKLECGKASDAMLALPLWGYVYLCAGHALLSMRHI